MIRREIALSRGSIPSKKRSVIGSATGSFLTVVSVAFAEEVRYHFRSFVASMVQAGQPETGFQRLGQGEVGVEVAAVHTAAAVVGVDDEQDLVGSGRNAEIVLVPNNDDGLVALLPGRRARKTASTRP